MYGLLDIFFKSSKKTKLVILSLLTSLSYLIMFFGNYTYVKNITVLATIFVVIFSIFWFANEFLGPKKLDLTEHKTDEELLAMLKAAYTRLTPLCDADIALQSDKIEQLEEQVAKHNKLLEVLEEKREELFDQGESNGIRLRKDGLFYCNSELGQELNDLINQVDNDIDSQNKSMRSLNESIRTCYVIIDDINFLKEHTYLYDDKKYKSILSENTKIIINNINIYDKILKSNDAVIEHKSFMVYARVIIVIFILMYFIIRFNPL